MLNDFGSQDIIYALCIAWVIYACMTLTKYFFAVQDDKIYLKTLKKRLVGNLALSAVALGLAIAVVKIFLELLG